MKKVRDTKGRVHAKMGIKDRNKGQKWCGPSRSKAIKKK